MPVYHKQLDACPLKAGGAGCKCLRPACRNAKATGDKQRCVAGAIASYIGA